MILAACVGLAALAASWAMYARIPGDGPWAMSRGDVASVRFGAHVVREGGVDGTPCGLARSDLLDAVAEGASDAVRVDLPLEEAGLDPGDRLKIGWTRGLAATLRVGRSAPVGGRTYVSDGSIVWAVRGNLRRAMEDVSAHCEDRVDQEP